MRHWQAGWPSLPSAAASCPAHRLQNNRKWLSVYGVLDRFRFVVRACPSGVFETEPDMTPSGIRCGHALLTQANSHSVLGYDAQLSRAKIKPILHLH